MTLQSSSSKGMQDALRLSDARLRAALKGSPVFIFGQDRDLRFTWAHNPGFGFLPSELVGQTDGYYYERQEDVALMAQIKRHVFETGMGIRQQVCVQFLGKLHHFDLTIEPIVNDQGEVHEITGVSYDISAHRQLEEMLRAQAAELRRADQRKNDFLAMLSHELRNPLAPILNGLQILQMPNASPTLVQRAMVVMQRQINQITHLLDDLLDVSRITRGKITLRQQRLDLRQLITDAVDNIRADVEASGQSITVELPEDSVTLDADATRLMQVLGNLLSNAIKYTPRHGKISVTLHVASGMAVLRISDTGMGIAPDLLPTVFDMFTQAPQALDRSRGGLGLGLTIVQRLVAMHGGTVTALSEGTDRGTAFVIRLPCAQQSATDASNALDQEMDATKCPLIHARYHRAGADCMMGMRVMIVDDNQDAASILAGALTARGMDVLIAKDGAQALDLVATHPLHVVLLDIGLPGMDGYEVATRLRSCPQSRHLKLVAVTGYGQDGDRRRAYAAGFDAYLLKPVHVERLLGGLQSFQISVAAMGDFKNPAQTTSL